MILQDSVGVLVFVLLCLCNYHESKIWNVVFIQKFLDNCTNTTMAKNRRGNGGKGGRQKKSRKVGRPTKNERFNHLVLNVNVIIDSRTS